MSAARERVTWEQTSLMASCILNATGNMKKTIKVDAFIPSYLKRREVASDSQGGIIGLSEIKQFCKKKEKPK